jgi:prepilin-type N-terminal cleavage/methylation domain-containing protein
MKNGFTIIEVLVCMTVLSIIAGVEVLLLQTGLEGWRYGDVRVELQRSSDVLMENLLEGGYDGDGIRDAVELKQAELNTIGFVPLWTDRTHKPDPIRNKEQKFILERQFKPGAPTPIGQVKKPGSADFVSVQVKFIYGSRRNPKEPDDVVCFLDPIPLGSELRILYTPDGDNDPEVIKIFRWDPGTKRVYESYGGKTQDLLKTGSSVTVEQCSFLFYDNLNRLIAMKEEALTPLSIKRATAVKLYLVLRQKSEFKELTSFTNVRNVATIGATISEGAELPMPTPVKIKAFSLGDFYGLRRDGIVELVVSAGGRPRWKVRLKFKSAPKAEDIILERFQMESPPGKIVTTGILEQTIAANEFVNIQTLDRTGLYDYDDDEEVRDLVVITGKNLMVTVTRLDFEGASLFIRP